VCGLYETVLAAYRALQDGYQEGRSNTVVVFTDGSNSKAGMSLETLQLELERATDPTRPVRVVLLGIGPDVHRDELEAIAATTGGRAFVV
jgi:Ca-activated chloride channel family protein